MENNNNQKVKPKFIGAGRFDSVNSFYQHKINLVNGIQLTGYSKGLLTPEMNDKIVLLERVILRLFHCNYFDPQRTQTIEFFLNNSFQAKELILILRPTSYSFSNNIELAKNERFYTFITRLYEQIKDGTIVTKSLLHKPKKESIDKLLVITRYKFQNEMELHTFLLRMRKQGVEEGRIFDFYFKYREKYF